MILQCLILTSPSVLVSKAVTLLLTAVTLEFVVDRLLLVVSMRLLVAVMLEFAVLILLSSSLIAARAFLAVVFSVAVPTLPDTVDNVLDSVLIALCRLFLVVLIRFVSVVPSASTYDLLDTST